MINKTEFNVRYLGYAIFLIGLIAAVVGLAAPIGVWLNSWDFRKGFAILRFVNAWALWVVYGCLALTVLTVLLGWLRKNRDGLIRAVSFAVVGTLFALLAWYIPETYRPADPAKVPPIHDIATNPQSPLQYSAVLPLRGENANTVVYGGSPNMTPEKLADLQLTAYPHIKPQIYALPTGDVFDQALAVANEMGWDIVAADKSSGRIEAVDTTFWFRFKDDIVIEVQANEHGGSVMNARSLSRVGVSDVGKNAARLGDFFVRMTAE